MRYFYNKIVNKYWFSSGNFFRAKSIDMKISIVMLLFSDQISGRGKSFQGGKLPQMQLLLDSSAIIQIPYFLFKTLRRLFKSGTCRCGVYLNNQSEIMCHFKTIRQFLNYAV